MPLPPWTPEQSNYPKNPKGILVCDICGGAVPANSNGLISWNTDEMNNITSFRLTHKGKCDKVDQQDQSGMLDFVNELGWGYVTDKVARYKWPGDALTRLVLIVWAVLAVNNPDWKPDY